MIELIPFESRLAWCSVKGRRFKSYLGSIVIHFFFLLTRNSFEKRICLISFFFSSISACLYLERPNAACLFMLLFLSLFFLPIYLVVLLLLVGRAVAFHDYSGFALFMQLAFLYGLQRMRKNLSLILVLYFFILYGLFWGGKLGQQAIRFRKKK